MPSLTWKDKHPAAPAPASIIQDSVVHPNGLGYSLVSGRGRATGHPGSRLILGDNLAVMSALLPEYEGRINLIYADPPFFTNRKFSARIGRGEDSRKPGEWQLAEGYHDAWTDLNSYLQFLYERIDLMYRLLAPNGTLYLHLDWHADAYARLMLDEFFGAENLLNEIIWTYHGPSPIKRAFNRKHDTILTFVKGRDYTFNADAVREPYNPNTVITFRSSKKAGFGKVPDLERGKVPEDWWYFPVVARLHNERTGYPTQKPEALLERIILASSNPGDIVADFFSGSGTTSVVAARHGRKFIACDETFRAVHTARSRLVDLESIFSFEHDALHQPKFFPVPGSTHVRVTPGSVSVDTTLDLDYWDVDPGWDGRQFRSAAQAKRHARSGDIPKELKLKTGRNICVRLVTVQGKQYQLNIQAVANAANGL